MGANQVANSLRREKSTRRLARVLSAACGKIVSAAATKLEQRQRRTACGSLTKAASSSLSPPGGLLGSKVHQTRNVDFEMDE